MERLVANQEAQGFKSPTARAMKYKAQGNLGCTYGLEVDGSYYTQTKFPNEFGSIHEMDEGGQFGWKWWMSKYEPEQIGEFPEQCDLTDKL